MASSRDRSRSPFAREGESDTSTILRLLDKISALKQDVKEKNDIIKEKNEVIADLKAEIADIVEDNRQMSRRLRQCEVKPPATS